MTELITIEFLYHAKVSFYCVFLLLPDNVVILIIVISLPSL